MFKRFAPILTLTAACWLVFLLNNLIWQGHLAQHGIIPRQLGSLTGILWAPFLHASFKHLAANTVPLLVLGAIICARGKGEFALVTVGGILLGGILTWLFARSADHIGVSGLIFCYFGYVASLAWFNRTFGTLCLSVVCILAYGGMVKGILPTLTPISWEGHLAGLVAGVVLGALMSRPKQEPAAPANPGPGSVPGH
jgi:membrane associated rhomboid family serine protease